MKVKYMYRNTCLAAGLSWAYLAESSRAGVNYFNNYLYITERFPAWHKPRIATQVWWLLLFMKSESGCKAKGNIQNEVKYSESLLISETKTRRGSNLKFSLRHSNSF